MIYVTNARCDRCGQLLKLDGPNATGDAQINAEDPSHPIITAQCKNIEVCRMSQPAALYQDGVAAYLWLS